ncbi:GntR family transcriptional regulator [Amycolatopsis pithecellobii]|uniref:FCD domain-containing protein n=1 Tax=Amycolatopsis pithecellobii TaxID=664692 RepID=A0A6N7YUQ1_9PSEU|nr:GntR family transcriptional regulator [Amycolatopsis pithecellobii]MTD55648.1 FCD domain-containing protein [Amycolatopsis pithecellobii]
MPDRVRTRPQFAQRPRLSDEVASYVRDLIMTGESRPGDAVNIDSLARDIGVSATPVREALMRLESEGFLIAEQNRSYTVAPLTREDIEDLFANHALIGGELAARAAKHVTPAFLADLERLQAEIEASLGRQDFVAASAANNQFHDAIVNRSGSTKLAWLFNIGVKFVPRSLFYPENPKPARRGGKKHVSVDDHHGVLDAMRAGDAEKARDAMSAHVSHVSKILVEYLEGIGFWAEDDDSPAGKTTPARKKR